MNKNNTELTERQKWLRTPWTVKSYVLVEGGGKRPYDPEKDLVEHLLQPMLNFVTHGEVKASYASEDIDCKRN